MSEDEQRRSEELRCELSDAEVQQRGQDAARLLMQIDQLDEEKRAAAADYKEQIKAKETELRKLGREIRERAEHRDVPCVTRPNAAAGVMETIRLDTGELVRSRPLTHEERQARFPFDARRAAAADDDD